VFELANQIRSEPSLKKLTEILRSLPHNGSQNDFKNKELPYVTFGGLFNERKDKRLVAKSGIICIDLDDLLSLVRIMLKLTTSPYLVMLFISPRGNGLKTIFRCNPKYSFKENYRALSIYLETECEIPKEKIDKKCANISRACFLCHDPKVWLNQKVTEQGSVEEIPFIMDSYFSTEPPIQSQKNQHEELNDESKINLFELSTFQYFPLKFNYKKRNDIENMVALCRLNSRNYQELAVGCRHYWFLYLAMLANRFGMQKDIAIKHCKSLFSNHAAILDNENKFDEDADLVWPFNDVYAKYAESFGAWSEDDKEWETPILSEDVFQKLPNFLKRLTDLFASYRERDVFFLGLITFLSTCFPRIKGVYDNRLYSMNLFTLISAPAASGKGVLTWIREIGEPIHTDFLERYQNEAKEYKEEKEKKEEKEDIKKNLPEPVLKKLFIPANNTSARMIASLHANEGKFGIIMDTEADVLTNSNKSEHGKFSELLRKAFHNEAVDYERKGNSEYISINKPALSMLMSGTPSQARYLIPDLESGLLSRFMYYSYTTSAVWKDVFAEKKDLSHIFKSEGKELLQLTKPYFHDYLFDSIDTIRFNFTSSQEKSFNNWFAEKLENMDHIYGQDIRGSVFRLGLIFFRISMVLTVIRSIDSGEEIKETLFCSDVDFQIANSIVSVVLHHTVHVFNELKKNKNKKYPHQKELFFDKLPNEFPRKHAMDIANLMQIEEKTAEVYLHNWVIEGKLVKPKHNHYKKPQP
jgi:hypothetical protein